MTVNQNRCACCGSTIVSGVEDESGNHYCNVFCRYKKTRPIFCEECVAETTHESTGGTYTVNSCGTMLLGAQLECPICHSVVKRKWFCLFLIPLIPLERYRVKPAGESSYYSRRLPKDSFLESSHRIEEEQRSGAGAPGYVQKLLKKGGQSEKTPKEQLRT